MEKLELKSGEQIEIQDGSSLSSIQIEVKDLNSFKKLCEKFTDENLAKISFLNEVANRCSIYKDKTLARAGYKPVEVQEASEIKLIVTVSLKDIDKTKKELNDLNKKLEEMQATTNVLSGAIAEIGSMVGGEK